MNSKELILTVVNSVVCLKEYNVNDSVFSQKYCISPVAMVYIITRFADELRFRITDELVDSLEMCTFGDIEQMLELYCTACGTQSKL